MWIFSKLRMSFSAHYVQQRTILFHLDDICDIDVFSCYTTFTISEILWIRKALLGCARLLETFGQILELLPDKVTTFAAVNQSHYSIL